MLVNMSEILSSAKAGGYAVGFFNTVNVEMARAVIETAEELRAPVMVGTEEALLPAMPLERVAEYLIPMARNASVPVCVHYDHGRSFETCMEAVKLGFTSIMYDCSMEYYDSNAARVAEVARICHAMDISVEGELGHVGDNEGAGRLENPADYYTAPAAAEDYARSTGIDALAVAVGNAHGEYLQPPKLDFERIRKIAVCTDLPLVLHGGSGISDADVQAAIKAGVCKINIFTALDRAGREGIERGLREGEKSLMQLIPYAIREMKTVVRHKIELFGSAGAAGVRPQ